MPTLIVDHTTDKNRDEIWEWMENKLEETVNRKIPRENIKLTPEPSKDRFLLAGNNIKAEITVSDGNVSCSIKVPLLFRPFKAQIEAGIRDVLNSI